MINVIKSNKSKNWGDMFGPVLIEKITGKKVSTFIGKDSPKGTAYLVCGSNLIRANTNTEVWGAGFISEDHKTDGIPQRVHCVRGPKSDEYNIGKYGDPGLLAAELFPPTTPKSQYRLGVIHHYRASYRPLPDMDDEVLEVDMASGIQEAIDRINLCDCVASESLHGLIIADSLGIPSTWIPTRPSFEAHWFKFYDYFESVGRKIRSPFDSWWRFPESVISSADCGDITQCVADLKETCPFEWRTK